MKRIIAIGISLLFVGCIGIVSSSKDSPPSFDWILALAGGHDQSPADSLLPSPAVQVSTAPGVTLAQYDSDGITVSESDIELPRRIGNLVPVGKVYEIGLDPAHFLASTDGGPATQPEGQIVFPAAKAELKYSYDATELAAAGFLEEFEAYYFDETQKRWLPLDSTITNTQTKEVTARTSHFTAIVLTAIPASTGIATANPPACILADYPAGSITSSAPGWTPRMTIVDSYFRYYQDRPYALSNPANVQALGFKGALAIATCNGNPAQGGFTDCGAPGLHKGYAGPGYIQFTAKNPIDVYVMYDVRGGVVNGSGLADTSHDASWLSSFTIVNAPLGAYIETEDTAQPAGFPDYRVYRKKYLAGEVVSLGGNLQGATGPSIQTNYWVVIRPAGSPMGTSTPAAANCTSPDLVPPAVVTNIEAIPGANRITLRWQNPNDVTHATTVIRTGSGVPTTPADGAPPAGSAPTTQSFISTGLNPGTNYCFSIFSLDANLAYQTPAPFICAMTDTLDTDNDGLSDVYENATVYPTTLKSSVSNSDTDGDGASDGAEVAAGTDPTNPDQVKPVVSNFALTSPTPTQNPIVTFDFATSDNVGVTGWIVTETDTPPLANHTGWITQAIANKAMPTIGVHTLYAWVRDAAGNVSNPVPLISVDVQSLLVDRFAFIGTGSNISSYAIDPLNGSLALIQSAAIQGGYLSLNRAQNRLYLYNHRLDLAANGTFNVINGGLLGGGQFRRTYFSPGDNLAYPVYPVTYAQRVFSLDPISGAPTLLQTSLIMGDLGQPSVTPDGKFVLHRNNRQQIDPVTGLLSAPTYGDSLYAQVISPSGLFVYSLDGSSVRVYAMNPLDVSLTLIQSMPAMGSLLILGGTGSHLYVLGSSGLSLYNVNPVNGLITASPAQTIGLAAYGAMMSATEEFLYVSLNNLTQIIIFRHNKGTGLLTQLTTQGIAANAMVTTGGLSTNDTPVVNVTPLDGTWVPVNQTVALSAAGSYDPDAARCLSDTTKYVYSWTQVAGPAVTITNASAISGASFTPPTAGDYTFQFSFRDDPANCNGSPQVGSKTIVIRAGVFHTQAVNDSCSGAGSPPFGTATFNTVSSRPREVGIMEGWWIILKVLFPPMFWGWVPLHACTSDELEYSAAYNQCVARLPQPLPFIPLWRKTQSQSCVTGTWNWWNYN